MARTPTSKLRAVAHPLRLQILSLLTGAAMSAAEIARELDVTHANASYHLRVLAEAGEVVEAGEEKIRGGVAKRFRHSWQKDAAARKQPGGRASKEDRRLYIRAMAEELVRRFDRRSDSGDNHLTDAEMWVSPEVWQQVLTHLRSASELIHGEARPPRTEGTIHVNLTAAGFRMDEVDGVTS